MTTPNEKERVSLVVCGHVDSGKSTLTGRLMLDLGEIDERTMAGLRSEAEAENKASFALAFATDTLPEERARGVSIKATTSEFFTDTKHFTIIDAPGHRDFIRNMITGAAAADAALLLVPADGNFESSIMREDHKRGAVAGQTRQHALLINLLGIKQLAVGINKIDATTGACAYSEARFNECRDETVNMLRRVGWKKEYIDRSVAILPLSGFTGDNVTAPSTKLPWWKGVTVRHENGNHNHVVTLLDALETMGGPLRTDAAPLRMPISHCFNKNGVVVTGRVECGSVAIGDEVTFLPSNASGRVFTIERHHRDVDSAQTGDNCGMKIKGIGKNDSLPRAGDVMVKTSDQKAAEVPLAACKSFTAQVSILAHPGELSVGYTPIALVRTSRSAVRLEEIVWKMGRDTGGAKVEQPKFLKAGDVACVRFAPQAKLIVEKFEDCEGLARVAILEGHTCVMMAKVVDVQLE